MYKALLEVHHWTPQQVGSLSFRQLRALSGDTKPLQDNAISYAEVCRRIAEHRKRKGIE